MQKERKNIIKQHTNMGHKISNPDKRNQRLADQSLEKDFVFTDVTREELDKRRIPVYSYLL